MFEAPPGYIPLGKGVIVRARSVIAVIEEKVMEVDPAWQAKYDAELAAFKAEPAEARRYRTPPGYYPEYRETGQSNVLVRWAPLAGAAAMMERCSLVQFIFKMNDAMAEERIKHG